MFQRVLDAKRLLRIEIPVDRFYDMQNIMIIFAHEAAHYVGTSLRNRPLRYEKLLYSYASIYVDYVVSFLMEKEKLPISIEEIKWITIKKRMEKMLQEAFEREKVYGYLKEDKYGDGLFKETQILGDVPHRETYYQHLSFMRRNMYRAMSDIVQFAIPNIFGGIAFGCEDKQQKEIWEIIREVSENFLVRHTEMSSVSMQTVDTVLEQLDHLYKESFSDIIVGRRIEIGANCILIFRLLPIRLCSYQYNCTM